MKVCTECQEPMTPEEEGEICSECQDYFDNERALQADQMRHAEWYRKRCEAEDQEED